MTRATNKQIKLAVDDTAFGVSWDGSLDAVSKNALYDIISSLQEGSNPDLDTNPVENDYSDVATMLADQANQTEGFFQFVSDDGTGSEAYYEKLSTSTSDISDYRKMSDDEIEVITNSNAWNLLRVKSIDDNTSTSNSVGGGRVRVEYDVADDLVTSFLFNKKYSNAINNILPFISSGNVYLQAYNRNKKEIEVCKVTGSEIQGEYVRLLVDKNILQTGISLEDRLSFTFDLSEVSSIGSVTLQEVIAEGNSSTLPIIIDNKNTTPTQFFGSALLTVESLMDVNGTSVGSAFDHYRNPTADSSGSDIYANFNRLVSESDFRDGRLQAFYSQAKYQGTAGLDTSMYGGRLESIFEGSGGMGSGVSSSDGFLIGVRSYTANKSNDNSNINSVRAFDSEAVMDSDNGTLNFLQGHHNNVTLIKGTINNDVSVNYLDFDYTSGTVNGDLAYITAKDTAIDFSFVDGTARFIDSLVPLPSRFGGSIEATELIVTGKTNDDILLGDGSTTSLAAIGGGSSYQNITETIDGSSDFNILIGNSGEAGINVDNQDGTNRIEIGATWDGLVDIWGPEVQIKSNSVLIGYNGFDDPNTADLGSKFRLSNDWISLNANTGLRIESANNTRGVTLKTNGVGTNNKYDINFPLKTGVQTFAMLSDITSSTYSNYFESGYPGYSAAASIGDDLKITTSGSGSYTYDWNDKNGIAYSEDGRDVDYNYFRGGPAIAVFAEEILIGKKDDLLVKIINIPADGTYSYYDENYFSVGNVTQDRSTFYFNGENGIYYNPELFSGWSSFGVFANGINIGDQANPCSNISAYSEQGTSFEDDSYFSIAGGDVRIINSGSTFPTSGSDSTSAAGTTGTIKFDSNYMYYNLNGTWLRFAVTPW